LSDALPIQREGEKGKQKRGNGGVLPKVHTSYTPTFRRKERKKVEPLLRASSYLSRQREVEETKGKKKKERNWAERTSSGGKLTLATWKRTGTGKEKERKRP